MKSLIIYLFERQNPFNVWIMCGLPGAGKSTWIKNNLSKNIQVVNQDSIRIELGIMKNDNDKKLGDKIEEKEVTKKAQLQELKKAQAEEDMFKLANSEK